LDLNAKIHQAENRSREPNSTVFNRIPNVIRRRKGPAIEKGRVKRQRRESLSPGASSLERTGLFLRGLKARSIRTFSLPNRAGLQPFRKEGHAHWGEASFAPGYDQVAPLALHLQF
jgi:hypothetical protein